MQPLVDCLLAQPQFRGSKFLTRLRSPLAGVWSAKRAAVLLCLPLLFSMATVVAQEPSSSSQALPVNDAEFRVRVNNLTLEGFSSLDNDRLSPAALNAELVAARARYPQDMTVDELHQIADALTLFVRKSGYVFHTVYLPPQKAADGRVKFLLQEGVLSDVHVNNKTGWKDKRFSAPFKPLMGRLLYAPKIEERVQALKAQGGFKVFAFYSRGKKPGEARLNLRVEESKARAFAVRFDNFGSQTSGEYRGIFQYSEYQFSGRNDTLSLAIMQALDGVSNTYGSLYYSIPTASLNTVWSFSASNNQFELGERYESLGLEGDVNSFRLGFARILEHEPSRRAKLSLDLLHKTNELTNPEQQFSDETSNGASIAWHKSHQFPASQLALNYNLGVSALQAEYEAIEESMAKLDAQLFLLRGFSSERTRNNIQLGLRGQFASKRMPSLETMALTGPYGVRGFESGLMSVDNGLIGSLEWQWPMLIQGKTQSRWRVEPFLFVDAAVGTRLQPEQSRADDSDGNFTGAGVGLRFKLGKRFSLQMMYAEPIDGERDEQQVDGDAIGLFELRWQ